MIKPYEKFTYNKFFNAIAYILLAPVFIITFIWELVQNSDVIEDYAVNTFIVITLLTYTYLVFNFIMCLIS